ncbi:sarcosine oxidase subunit gamma [Zhihengliuella halotolerans]|uniref:Sarcosine oxidase subunit gamma n=1 Tax=Zhihengliuella halotolerans TaxID=370736 RepID=A0A4V2GA90_9MICC|nr:sarcosine oxidase subunit gamma family protein [Zhihengliuella halotolerans]RZU63316.1 sarcosine oxidase subunit gamma [Zhihengliuella halotolerans]
MAETVTIDSVGPEGRAPADVATLNTLRVSPAGHLAAAMAAAAVEGERSVALKEIPFTVQLGVRAEPGSASAQALEAVFGVDLPTRHGQVAGDASALHLIWLAPDEFLAVDVSRQQGAGEADEAAAALEGLPGQVIDLSANRTILELSGASARKVLEKGCHADLHPRAFAVGAAIVTQLGPVPIILHRTGESEFRLYPRSSFADYQVRWLLDAMEEFASDEVR